MSTSSRGNMPEWPNDADGDALRRIWNDRADFTVKHVFDFQIDFDNPDQIADAVGLFPPHDLLHQLEDFHALGFTVLSIFKTSSFPKRMQPLSDKLAGARH